MRRALGKGLSQLIGDQFETSENETPIESIVPNSHQPRRKFAEEPLEDLANSIREHGILQPLVVRPISEGRYELIAGERRLRAAQIAGLTHVPISIRSANNQNSLELALIENIQREDINAYECALAYRQLISQFGLTQEQVADKVGKSRTAVTNVLRLLKLPSKVLEALDNGVITEGHARALLAFPSSAMQLALLDRIVKYGLTVRDLEKMAAETPGKKKVVKLPGGVPEWRPIEEGMSTRFGAPVHLMRTPKGGKIQIDFYSDDDLQRILDTLGFEL